MKKYGSVLLATMVLAFSANASADNIWNTEDHDSTRAILTATATPTSCTSHASRAI